MTAREDLAEVIRDGEGTWRTPLEAADAILKALEQHTLGYVVVGHENDSLGWDDQMYETVEAAMNSLCGPYQDFERDPESPNYWGKEYRICPVSELAVAE